MSGEIEKTQKEAYFASLAEWTKQAHQAQEAMYGFPGYLLAKYPQLFGTPNGGQYTDTEGRIQQRPIQAPVAAPLGQNRRPARRRDWIDIDQQTLRERHGGYLVELAPLWKRAIAQALDMYILILLKALIAHWLVGQFPSLGNELVWQVVTDDAVMYYLDISSSLQATLVRMLLKLLGYWYEPLLTSCCNGFTPGKWLMEIRIMTASLVLQVHTVDERIPRQSHRVVFLPQTRLSMRRAFVRSLVKLFVTTIILPISIRFVFRRNEAYYDLWTKTLVVQANSNGVYSQRIRVRSMRAG